MKFAIRDDDINYYTNPNDLEKIYKNIWNKIPVSFSVIPFANKRYKLLQEKQLSNKKENLNFVKNINKDKKQKLNLDTEFFLNKNKVLINFLQQKYKQEKIDIMLHGYNHNFCKNGYEFEVEKNLEAKVKKGKNFLEKIFDTKITTFVPPNNSLSSKGAKAVVKNDLNILMAYGYYPWERPLRFDYLYNFLKIYKNYLKHKRKISYPYVLNFKEHKELACYSFNQNTDTIYLKNGFQYALQNNGNFCLATHYWELAQNKQMLKTFYKFIEYAKKHKNIEFVKASNLFI